MVKYHSGNNTCQSRHSGESRNPDVVPVKTGNQNEAGCRIESGMTFYMFRCRSNKIRDGQKEEI